MHWSVLAASGMIESNHGQSTLPGVHSGANPSAALGPMRFLQRTFDAVTARHPIPPGGATPPSAYNPHDAVYLCNNGARDNRNLTGAIYTYNHDHDHASFSQPILHSVVADDRESTALAFARAQLGKP